jgi:hypothetical protein
MLLNCPSEAFACCGSTGKIVVPIVTITEDNMMIATFVLFIFLLDTDKYYDECLERKYM